jgi:hypothetical protein
MDLSDTLDLYLDIGADWSIRVTLEGIAIPVDGPVEFVVEDADGIQLAAATIGNGVTVESASPDAELLVEIARATSATFAEGRHRYALWVTDVADKRQAYLHGAIVARQLPEADS